MTLKLALNPLKPDFQIITSYSLTVGTVCFTFRDSPPLLSSDSHPLLRFMHSLTCALWNERTSVLFWPVLGMEGWGSNKVCVFQRGFHVGVSGCPPSPLSLLLPWDMGRREGLLGPQDQPSPISKPPWENLNSGPDVTAGPATLEVKVKGNHVKFATHYHLSW